MEDQDTRWFREYVFLEVMKAAAYANLHDYVTWTQNHRVSLTVDEAFGKSSDTETVRTQQDLELLESTVMDVARIGDQAAMAFVPTLYAARKRGVQPLDEWKPRDYPLLRALFEYAGSKPPPQVAWGEARVPYRENKHLAITSTRTIEDVVFPATGMVAGE